MRMSVDVVQSVVLQIEVIPVSLCPLLLKKNQGLSHGFIIFFSHVNANTGRIHIHVALAR